MARLSTDRLDRSVDAQRERNYKEGYLAEPEGAGRLSKLLKASKARRMETWHQRRCNLQVDLYLSFYLVGIIGDNIHDKLCGGLIR